jgi:hypothetical protein
MAQLLVKSPLGDLGGIYLNKKSHPDFIVMAF